MDGRGTEASGTEEIYGGELFMGAKRLVGQTFGRLTVLEEYRNEKGYIVCRCLCDCGNEKVVYKGNITAGRTRSCGCLEQENRSKYRDITQMRFGRLIALNPTQKRLDGSIVWKCLCDCGNTAFVQGRRLVRGQTKSCGCLGEQKREKTKIAHQRFGRLVALHIDPDNHSKRQKWICQCDCGNVCSVSVSNLKNGHTKSCGCLLKEENRIMVEGTCLEQIASERLPLNNRSGVKGVSYHSRTGKWVATINLSKKHYFLGSYENLEDAAEIRRVAEKQLFDPIIQRHAHRLKMKGK